MCFLESESDDIKRLSYPPSFFKFIEPSAKDGNSMYVCQVKDCPRMGKTLSTINNSRGNLRAHIKVWRTWYDNLLKTVVLMHLFVFRRFIRKSWKSLTHFVKKLMVLSSWASILSGTNQIKRKKQVVSQPSCSRSCLFKVTKNLLHRKIWMNSFR